MALWIVSTAAATTVYKYVGNCQGVGSSWINWPQTGPWAHSGTFVVGDSQCKAGASRYLVMAYRHSTFSPPGVWEYYYGLWQPGPSDHTYNADYRDQAYGWHNYQYIFTTPGQFTTYAPPN